MCVRVFCILQEAAKPFRDVRLPVEEVEINQITKLTKRAKKIVLIQPRVRSTEDDPLETVQHHWTRMNIFLLSGRRMSFKDNPFEADQKTL